MVKQMAAVATISRANVALSPVSASSLERLRPRNLTGSSVTGTIVAGKKVYGMLSITFSTMSKRVVTILGWLGVISCSSHLE